MKTLVSLVLSLTATVSVADEIFYRVKEKVEGDKVQVISVDPIQRKKMPAKVTVRALPMYLTEGADGKTSSFYYRERFLFGDELQPLHKSFIKQFGVATKTKTGDIPGSEMRTLAKQGPASNRINLTMLGDGYTLSEKEQFFKDAQRLTDDLFQTPTFRSYLPLFNVYAVFVPSRDSGITDRTDKDTALGLYRSPAGSKRAIMPGNTSFIERALKLAPATDYPILIANDNYYGGLGGRYAITTRSVRSGAIVLRHELGHNFGNVGEEYDGGQVYQGANSSDDPKSDWGHWFTAGARKYDAKFLTGDYVWQNLSAEDYTDTFEFPAARNGRGYTFELWISTVGWQTPSDVTIELDGAKLAYTGEFTEDRGFFKISPQLSPAPGKHTLRISENIHDGNNVLAFAEVYAYEPGYDFSKKTIAGYPTFYSPGSPSGYRPTHDACLMRDMMETHFCAVDQENMWVRFLSRVKLIDTVTLGVNKKNEKIVKLSAPDLEELEISWYKLASDGSEQELTEYRDQLSWKLPEGMTGKFRVRAVFETDEVREYTKDFEAKHDFQI